MSQWEHEEDHELVQTWKVAGATLHDAYALAIGGAIDHITDLIEMFNHLSDEEAAASLRKTHAFLRSRYNDIRREGEILRAGRG